MSGGARAAGQGAHPRACGENLRCFGGRHGHSGSSPRVRGKPARSAPGRLQRGLIPARAGKTSTNASSPRRAEAHPRACGENYYFAIASHAILGSSPRVRGKPQRVRESVRDVRLIPARAGKTSTRRRGSTSSRAHPRACGENDHHRRAADPHLGLIPARAGKTHRRDLVQDDGGAHPRACGENHRLGASWAWGHGSSPRVRGKPSAPHGAHGG